MKKDTKCYIQMGVIIGGTIGLGVLTAGLGPAILGPTIISTSIKKIAELAINMAPELLGELLDDRLDESAFEKLNEEFKKSFNKEISLQKNDFRNIFKEVGEKIKPNFWGNIWEKPAVFFTKKENKERRKDNQAIQRASSHVTKYINDYLFSIKIEEIFYESKTYQGLNSNDKEVFKKLLENLREESLYEEFQKLETEDQITISIIEVLIKKSNWEIKEELKEIKEIITTYLSQVRVNGGSIEQIQSNVQSLKLLSHECPNCGYYGQHLYFNESNTKVYCAACGKEYSILKDIEGTDVILERLEENHQISKEIAEKMLTKEILENCLSKQNDFLETIKNNGEKAIDSIVEQQELLKKIGVDTEKQLEIINKDNKTLIRELENVAKNQDAIKTLVYKNIDVAQSNEEALKSLSNYLEEKMTKGESQFKSLTKRLEDIFLELEKANAKCSSDGKLVLSEEVKNYFDKEIKNLIEKGRKESKEEHLEIKELLKELPEELKNYIIDALKQFMKTQGVIPNDADISEDVLQRKETLKAQVEEVLEREKQNYDWELYLINHGLRADKDTAKKEIFNTFMDNCRKITEWYEEEMKKLK